jgi:kynurenine 3-monooxygenase
VDRKLINQLLLTEAEKNKRVELNFNSSLVNCNFDLGTVTIQKSDGDLVTITDADLIIGADGAHSKVRAQMMRHMRYI